MSKKLPLILIVVAVIGAIVIISRKQTKSPQPSAQTKTKPADKTKTPVTGSIKTLPADTKKVERSKPEKAVQEASQPVTGQISPWIAKDTSEYDKLSPEERRQKIVNLTVQARTRLKNGQYGQAVLMAEHLLILDPGNKEALSLMERAKAGLIK